MITTGSLESMASPKNIGIHALEIYIPKKCVDQAELESFDGVSAGKYTIGLGQTRMAVCDDREDINSICLTAVASLMEKYQIDYNQIGRLEVGTETIIDKSKSVKSVLMQLFAESGNSDVEGVDTTNACYGGTNALFNALNWLESSACQGRLALVVAADIAVYKNGSARPTGGAGAVAILLGPDAPIVFDGIRATHVEHAYDFYKPDLHSEYPVVDGPLSNMCYIKALDTVYNRYLSKMEAITVSQGIDRNVFDFLLFHTPYNKLVQKSYGRLAYNDFKRNSSAPEFSQVQDFAQVKLSDSYTNKDLEKTFMNLTKQDFAKRVSPSLLVAKNVGNMYCGSLYGGLCALVSEIATGDLQGKRIGFFSYGSGLAASMFSAMVVGSTQQIAQNLNVAARLKSRSVIPPSRFDEIMQLREKTHNVKDYTPVSQVDESNLFPGTFYLENVDGMFRRSYKRLTA